MIGIKKTYSFNNIKKYNFQVFLRKWNEVFGKKKELNCYNNIQKVAYKKNIEIAQNNKFGITLIEKCLPTTLAKVSIYILGTGF